MRKHFKLNQTDKDDHLLHRDDIIHHSGSTFTDKEVNIVLLIILAVIILLFWIPLAEFVH